MTVSESPTLTQQLEKTKQAVLELTAAVEHLTAATSRARRWNIVLGSVVAIMVPVVVGLCVLTFFFIEESRDTDAGFANVSRELFMLSCQGNNANKELIRSQNVKNGELLISIAMQSGRVQDPATIAAFRDGIVRQNAEIKDRDCAAEFREANNAGK